MPQTRFQNITNEKSEEFKRIVNGDNQAIGVAEIFYDARVSYTIQSLMHSAHLIEITFFRLMIRVVYTENQSQQTSFAICAIRMF